MYLIISQFPTPEVYGTGYLIIRTFREYQKVLNYQYNTIIYQELLVQNLQLYSIRVISSITMHLHQGWARVQYGQVLATFTNSSSCKVRGNLIIQRMMEVGNLMDFRESFLVLQHF